MRARFHLQDPTDVGTAYLSEVLVEQVRDGDAATLEIVVAFATADGLKAIVEDPDFVAFAEQGSVRVVVGVDAITLPEALDVLAEAKGAFPDFQAQVFDNPTRKLFHPKLARLTRDDGSTTLIVGSGNATAGGLQGNFEAFVVVDLDADEAELARDVDEFFERHADDLRDLDERAYELAEANRGLIRRREDAVEVEPDEEEDNTQEEGASVGGEGSDVGDEEELELPAPKLAEPVLVAQVPHAADRWGQVGLNEAVVDRFFQVAPNSAQRVRLRQVIGTGEVAGTEIRGIRMSEINRNRRLEIRAARGRPYPRRDTPILVFRERGVRQYDYMLVFPGEDGHVELRNILNTRPRLGRGDPRVTITTEDLADEWPDSPLLDID